MNKNVFLRFSFNIARYSLLISLCIVFGSCKADNGTRRVESAKITSVSPSFANPGQTDIEGRIYGSGLEGMSSIDLGDGVDVQSANVISTNEVYLFFSVSPNAAPGPRTVTFYAVEGVTTVSNAFLVGDNRLPKATFTVNPPNGYRSTTFRFDASKSLDTDGNVASYRWDFDDHHSVSGKAVTHQFQASGSFEVNLTVTDNRGAASKTSRFVEVQISKPPVANFSISPSSAGDTSTTFRFDAASSRDPDGNIAGYAWSFGDGSSDTGQEATHRYSTAGTYSVSLTVSDNTHLSARFSRTVTVQQGGVGDDDDDDDDGGGGGECRETAHRQPILYGTVVGMDRSSNSVDVQFPSGTTCSQANVRCGDFRKTDPEKFYGIVRRVFDLGNGRFRIFVDCPPSFPDTTGESVFIIYKTCSDNFCP